MSGTPPSLDPILSDLLARASALYGVVRPCSGKTWAQCITYQSGYAMLWFNVVGGELHNSTRTVVRPMGAA